MPGSLFGAVVAASISRLTQARLDEALGLAVRTRRIGFGAEVFQPEPSTQAPKRIGAVAGTVVCHDSLKADTQPSVVTHRLQRGLTGTTAALVRMQAGEGQAPVSGKDQRGSKGS